MASKTNEKLIKYLIESNESCSKDLQPFLGKDKLIDGIHKEFLKFNFDDYQKRLESQIRVNLKEWWTNPKKGIKRDEKLFAILFEYDCTWWNNREAFSYGINEWENFEDFIDSFNMGYDYDFATEFYAAPGITVDYFNCFRALDDNSVPKYQEIYRDDDDDDDGFYKLVEFVKSVGLIKIQESFAKLFEEGLFETLNTRKDFLFIVGGHDGESIPIFSID